MNDFYYIGGHFLNLKNVLSIEILGPSEIRVDVFGFDLYIDCESENELKIFCDYLNKKQ